MFPSLFGRCNLFSSLASTADTLTVLFSDLFCGEEGELSALKNELHFPNLRSFCTRRPEEGSNYNRRSKTFFGLNSTSFDSKLNGKWSAACKTSSINVKLMARGLV